MEEKKGNCNFEDESLDITNDFSKINMGNKDRSIKNMLDTDEPKKKYKLRLFLAEVSPF